jgi:hypothetical protein
MQLVVGQVDKPSWSPRFSNREIHVDKTGLT